MFKKLKILIILNLLLNQFNQVIANDNFFEEAKKKFDAEKIKDSKFLFQRNIVFNPKDAKSYLYLAKIYKFEENKKEELKNLNTTLLLEPNNEDAIQMLIDYELKKSNYSKVKELIERFKTVCIKLCKKSEIFEEKLKNIEPKNES